MTMSAIRCRELAALAEAATERARRWQGIVHNGPAADVARLARGDIGTLGLAVPELVTALEKAMGLLAEYRDDIRAGIDLGVVDRDLSPLAALLADWSAP